MTDLSPISERLHAIQARVAQFEQMGRSADGRGARLGFGLALQNAAIEANVPSTAAPSTGAPAPAPAPAAPTTSVLGSPSIALGTGPDVVSDEPDVGIENVEPNRGLTPATVRPGSYGRLEPPAELLAYGNGRIPANALTEVGETGHLLYAPAARALNALIADAALAGQTVGITDSYRSYEAQVDLAERKGLYSQGGLAATPGTSNHGWGMATDLRLDDSALAWMRENAWQYGFVEDVPREPWHWTYRPDPS